MAERKPRRQPPDPAAEDEITNGAGKSGPQTPLEDAIPEAVLETAEILADPTLRAALERSAEDMREGRVVPLEQLEHELGV